MENYSDVSTFPQNMADAKRNTMINFLSKVELYLGISRNDGQIDKHSRKTQNEILFIAADLGHYIADAHMHIHQTITMDNLRIKEFTLYGKVEFLNYL
jgi:hypothetical protein